MIQLSFKEIISLSRNKKMRETFFDTDKYRQFILLADSIQRYVWKHPGLRRDQIIHILSYVNRCDGGRYSIAPQALTQDIFLKYTHKLPWDAGTVIKMDKL